MRSNELPERVYMFISDSQELACVCAFLGIEHAKTIITAALVAPGDGDYENVYLSEGGDFKDSANWDWQPASFYTDHIPEELDLQDTFEESRRAPDPINWDEWGECGTCGTKVDTKWTFDPFLSEIWDETVMGWWCDDCYSNRNDDI